MYLFYDTETTGVNAKKDHVVQLAALLTYPNGQKAQSFDLILKCPVSIPSGASNIHGITDEISSTLGVEPGGALMLFEAMLQRAQVAVAYNDAFDVGMISEAMKRMDGSDYSDPFASVKRVCAMQMATDRFGRKRKLIEVHEQLFGRGFDGAHDAMNDVIACKDVFFELLRLKREDAARADVSLQVST